MVTTEEGLAPEAHIYLLERGILDPDLIRAAGLRLNSEGNRVVIPYRRGDGSEFYFTARSINGVEPRYKYQAGEKPPLYLTPRALDADDVVLVEGHMNALLADQAGYAAVATGGSFSDAAGERLATRRRVTIVKDNDEGGTNFRRNALDFLRGKVELYEAIIPEGFNDFGEVAQAAPEHPDDAVRAILEKATSVTSLETMEVSGTSTSLSDVLGTFDRWLLLDDLGAVEYTIALAVANRFEADPLWGFIVAASGGAKTELIASLSGLPEIHPLSDLTAQTFISGMKGQSKASLLMRLEPGTVLTLKDFTTVLTIHREQRQMILSQLREIYDGSYRKAFGTGEQVDWEGKLGFVAGVTPVIDSHYSVYQVLGERFIQYRTKQPPLKELASRALDNSGSERRMREELSAAVATYVEGLHLPPAPPDLDPEVKQAIIALAILTVHGRSGVVRDGGGELELVPEPEAPTRLAKQLKLLGSALAVMHGHTVVGAEEYVLVKKVALDTIPANRLRVLRALRQRYIPVDTSEIAEAVRYPTSTTRRVLEDLVGHGMADTEKPGQTRAHTWWLTEETRSWWEEAEAL